MPQKYICNRKRREKNNNNCIIRQNGWKFLFDFSLISVYDDYEFDLIEQITMERKIIL